MVTLPSPISEKPGNAIGALQAQFLASLRRSQEGSTDQIADFPGSGRSHCDHWENAAFRTRHIPEIEDVRRKWSKPPCLCSSNLWAGRACGGFSRASGLHRREVIAIREEMLTILQQEDRLAFVDMQPCSWWPSARRRKVSTVPVRMLEIERRFLR